VTAVAHFPSSLDNGWLEKLRRPLAALAATLLVVDLMGLGMHLADSAQSPFADDAPTRAKTTIGGPEAVVPNTAVSAGDATRQAARTSEPLGCLALDSGCYVGPPAPTATPTNTPTGSNTTPPGKTPTPTPAPAPQPLAQADVGVPALGVEASLGLGDGSCTGLDLTLIAVGDCPPATGDGGLRLNLGGSLLGD
jgi:hypothetical protein